MIEAHADIALGEAIRPAAEAHRRVYNGGWIAIIVAAFIFAFGSLAGMLVASWSVPILDQWAGIFTILGFIAGAMLAIAFYSRAHLKGFLRGLRKIGSPDLFPTHFRFDDRGVSVETDRLSHNVPWSAVLFVVPSPKHWLLQIDTTTLAVPRRAFASTEDEQAFVELAKSRLSEAARERSVFENQ